MKKDETYFGMVLRAIRKSRRLSQTELAEKAGIDQSYLNKIENGKRMPSDEVLFRLADVLVAEELFTAAGISIPAEFEKKYPLQETELPQIVVPSFLENLLRIYGDEARQEFKKRLEKEDKIKLLTMTINTNLKAYYSLKKDLEHTLNNEKLTTVLSIVDTLFRSFSHLEKTQYDLEIIANNEGEARGKVWALDKTWRTIEQYTTINLSGFLQEILKLDKNDAEFLVDIINVRKNKKPPII